MGRVITASTLDALYISFNTVFKEAYMQSPAPLLEKIGTRVPSNTRDQRYPFMQTLSGGAREWLGERVINNAVVDGFMVTNKKWENTVAIDRTDIEDDQYGVYSSMIIPNLARNMKLLPDLQIASLINSNFTCFDGRNFFASNHYKDPQAATGSQSNSLTGKPLNATNLAIAQQTMMAWVGPDLVPFGSYGSTLLVPPSLSYVAQTLANAAFFPEAKNGSSNAVFAAQTNIFQGSLDVVVSPHLTDSGDPATAVWYLLDTRDTAMRPFFWQEHTAPQFVSLVDPANPKVFMEDKFYFGARARGAAAGSLWFKALKVSGA